MWLGDTIGGQGTSLAPINGAWSHDPFPLAGGTECHQLYKPPGHTTGGLSLLGHSGEHTLVQAVPSLIGSSPYHGN